MEKVQVIIYFKLGKKIVFYTTLEIRSTRYIFVSWLRPVCLCVPGGASICIVCIAYILRCAVTKSTWLLLNLFKTAFTAIIIYIFDIG